MAKGSNEENRVSYINMAALHIFGQLSYVIVHWCVRAHVCVCVHTHAHNGL